MKPAALLLAALVLACLCAPLYATHVSGTDPFRSNVSPQTLPENTGGLGLGTTPIGPGWRASYLLGADAQGRDIAARLLYGGRTSLLIATAATLLCLALATILGTLAGFTGGLLDTGLSALLDLLWAFPVYLLALSLSAVLAGHEGADSLLVPTAILALVYVPYVARPVRAEVRRLRQAEFVEAAAALGASPAHILRRHILPHLWPTVASLAPVIAATVLLTEAALSILGVGVQPPGASWGTLLADGQPLLYTRPAVSIAPGAAIVLTVLALNALAEPARP